MHSTSGEVVGGEPAPLNVFEASFCSTESQPVHAVLSFVTVQSSLYIGIMLIESFLFGHPSSHTDIYSVFNSLVAG